MAVVLVVVVVVFSLIAGSVECACSVNDRDILLKLQSGFSSNAVLPWNVTEKKDCCTWDGIACTKSGRVRSLKLPNAGLYTSEIPSGICRLSKLENLTLVSFGAIFGIIPRCIGTSLTLLQYLDLGHNLLVGRIPTEFGRLTNLQYLDLGENNLGGGIPSELCKLKNLQHLDISRPFVKSSHSQGTLPPCLGTLTSLKFLRLDGNFLTGNIPSSLGNLRKLEMLRLEKNEFTGSIPSSLGNLVRLRTFHLDGNSITGIIPASFKNLVSLDDFYFENLHNISGELPDFTGFKLITRLRIANTKISGPIPSSFKKGKMEKIEELSLSENLLNGTIPSNLAPNLPKLKRLYLDDNRLSGRIPKSFDSFAKLDLLYLRKNRLTGAIPKSLSHFSVDSFEQNPGLCGTPLPPCKRKP